MREHIAFARREWRPIALGALAVAVWIAGLMALGAMVIRPAMAQDLTEQERQDRATVVLDFTQCAGLYWAWSDIAQEMGGYHSDDIETAEGNARGAQLVATLLALSTMADPRQAGPFVDEQVENNRTTWRSKLRGGGSPDLPEWLTRCLELNAMQSDIITRLRQNDLTRRR